jgi:hypothetical protein
MFQLTLIIIRELACEMKLNPLTPDLNAPAQQRPAEVFKCGFLFLTLTLRKKIISHTLLHQI